MFRIRLGQSGKAEEEEAGCQADKGLVTARSEHGVSPVLSSQLGYSWNGSRMTCGVFWMMSSRWIFMFQLFQLLKRGDYRSGSQSG
jgi:hypothetical protein